MSEWSGWSDWIARGCLVMLLVGGTIEPGRGQDQKPTAEQIAAVRACEEKNQDDVTEAERQCLFNLVATPCQSTPEGQSNLGMADCFRLEEMVWDDLLNETYRSLREDLKAAQQAELRDMQRAWIASRDATCAFYDVRLHGTIAIPLGAACRARETARRALLLKSFAGL
jgi:uncharacterized protein YecT (DUF1311 family)